jgi:tetratricopeptide (TPR) repeat protein
MGKGKIVFRVNVTKTEEENRFQVTWFDLEQKQKDCFEAQAPEFEIGSIYARTLWKSEEHALETGEKLYRFLDGDSRHLERALKNAWRKGQSLELYISICVEAADWPFELLAKEGNFLLTKNMHLIRSVSDRGEAQAYSPHDRPMKLLFMACSAQDVKPELDFEKEEESIFKITEKLPLEMDVEDSGSLEGLREWLELHEYDVVHLSGHADIDAEGRPYFIMENETGYRHDVFPEDLWDEALLENPPRLLFLSGCRTGELPDTEERAAVSFASLMVEKFNVPAVLGWGRFVNDEEATFAEKAIYKRLSQGKSILEAIQMARQELKKKFILTLNPAWPLLRLFNCGVDPGVIVKPGQKYTPKPITMIRGYLGASDVQILKKGFVGRRRQLQQSLRVLRQNQDKVGVLLLGTGGLGKSCLAGKICERFVDHYLIVVHGKLNSHTIRTSLKDTFITSQDEKGRELLNAEKGMTEILEDLCATSFKEKNYLIVLDDFEQNLEGAEIGEPDRLMAETREILRTLLYYLAKNMKMTQLIITCRYNFSMMDQNRDLIDKYLEPIYLTSFGETESRKKVKELKNILNFPDYVESQQLLEAGCGNPRLMEWIDTLVGEMASTDVPQLLTAVKDKHETYVKEHLIRELLQRSGEDLTCFLQWFSVYRIPVQETGAKIVGEKAGLNNWKKLLEKGLNLSLIEYDANRKSYRLTPLFREELLKSSDDYQASHEAAFRYYKTLDENKSEEGLDAILVEEWIYHALGCGEEDMVSRQGGQLVKYLREQLSYRESKRVGLWILAEKKKSGRELTTTCDSFLLNEIAYTVNVLGEPHNAVSLYEQALKIDTAYYGPTHPDVAVDINNLGSALDGMGECHEALKCYEKAMRIDIENFGSRHPNIAIRLNNLGAVWSDLGEHRKAIGYFEEALGILREYYGIQHPHVASTLNNLGLEWKILGEFKKAIDYFRQALHIDEAHFGHQHPNVARELNNLGVAHFEAGQKKEAKVYFREAYTIKLKFFAPTHPSVMKTARWIHDLEVEQPKRKL